jgi:membrane fusion protein, multidrug efflux system
VPQALDATLPKANEVGEGRQRPGNLPNPEDKADDGYVRSSSTEHQGDTTPAPGIPSFLRRYKAWVIIAALAFVVLCAGGILWWLNARQYEWTDDAFIDARIVPISAQVSGAIVDLAVTDNQFVMTGGTLLRIDDRDYRAALDQAKAQVEQADATIANLGAQIDAQQARVEQARRQVAEARATLTFAQEQNARAQDLVNRGAGTVEAAQQAASDLKQKREALDATEAGEVATQKQVAVLETERQVAHAELDQAKAQQETAEANLSRTLVKAPVDGYATKITASKGAYAQPGQALMMFVPRDMWVTANFKETQLDLMRVGQPATIEIDAYPDTTFHGHVKSIQAGSGAAFSLLPPENATGNYVKVVQRVPVKIVFDNPPGVYVGPGMSVVPSVKVR